MPLGRDRTLFTQEWVDRLKSVPERGMAAQVLIFEPGESVYDVDTDTWTDAQTTIYSGPARVQPLRSVSHKPEQGNDAFDQTYLVSLPVEAATLDFRTSQTMHVTDSPLNPSLETYVFTVWETADSSNPLERTLMAQANQDERRG